ncbi:DUF4332 domain-containing protein [Planctomycetes bacterium K23_9]|uniref:DUF4332 domain-containing protein n=1 Tax=Stieleria marina TaxID=1930275 RepID=A0A517NW56_9BACT|nr:hypothetical protein K239x_33330 [Planctomycetes bacterium K23_9]
MLRSLLKLIKNQESVDAVNDVPPVGETASHPAGSDTDSRSISDGPMIAGKIGAGGIVEVSQPPVPAANHRAWLLSKDLTHIKICSPRRCERLAKYGIVTAGDLAKVDAEHLVQQMNAPHSAVRSLRRYSASIRLAASVPGMMPRDAQLLICIHRHSVRAIAIDSPTCLYQDLQRFAHSTAGRRLVRERRLPSLRKVKSWVKNCREQGGNQAPMRAAA